MVRLKYLQPSALKGLAPTLHAMLTTKDSFVPSAALGPTRKVVFKKKLNAIPVITRVQHGTTFKASLL